MVGQLILPRGMRSIWTFCGNEECTENPIRLYSLDEITEIFCKLGLRICNSFADFSGKPSSDNDIQLMVYSIRE